MEEELRSDSFWKRFLFFGAIKDGNWKRLRKLILKGFRVNGNLYYGLNPLSLAVKYAEPETVRILLDAGCDPNRRDEITGLSPLIHSILEENPIEIVSILLEGGADPDLKDFIGMSPLHHCVNEGKLEPFRILLEFGADPNVQDNDGVTCMNLAKSSHGMSEFAELLLKYGADPMIKDKHGKIYLM
ncbi:ankyrin repeat domain-containing protein [Leptospira gomenensis]|uniref:Ankyrin repeat domain-containing protein n=1 Tax=Leptospira gomenensis TaxID=2484974 RepID=A0A5F1Y9S9_9LEPT|nr:ankyrin repeat domain-containing protein [Leptospira gomenensis]TGK33325.1 ankyrin repeat domain-containing protein [Leptospira gomenensis]TGK37380.1 ankyrin repeat domain-containing protein [Leptospira gomenensis]TGK40569.1 ankyrin repeat domain-containing protein [Leptospira gomenensis]TGK56491.1 ankyrin repeat domain-containing protein [Leptospira gomenensis]